MDFENEYTTEAKKVGLVSKNSNLINEELKNPAPVDATLDTLNAEINLENSKIVLSNEAYIIAKLLNLLVQKP